MKLKFILKLHIDKMGKIVKYMKDSPFKVGDSIKFCSDAKHIFPDIIKKTTGIITNLKTHKDTENNSFSIVAKLEGIDSFFNLMWFLPKIEYKLL